MKIVFRFAVLFFACNPHFTPDGSRGSASDAAVSDASADSGVLADAGTDADGGISQDPDCPNPSYPQDCEDGDGYCWPPEVDCDTTLFTCGASASRCIDTTAYAACCDGDFFVCGIAYPWYCYADGHCHRAEEDCPADADAGYVCDFRGVPCS